MDLAGDVEMRLKHFKTLWDFCYPNAKILITGRPNFFFDEDEMMTSLGIGMPTPGKPYCSALRLKPFNLSQIRTALRSHDDVLRSEICGFAQENDEFRELISRPSLLHVVSVIWRNEELALQRGRLTSAYGMERFVRNSFRRQGTKESDSPEFMALTTEERQYVMKSIATYMAGNDLQNQIPGTRLNEIVAALIEVMPEAVSLRSSAISRESRMPLKSRISDADHGVEFVQTDVRTCGILVDDPATLGAFRFGHKSFMEYLLADVVSSVVMDDEEPDAASILSACGADAGVISRFPVSIRFLSEMLGTDAGALDRRDQKRLAERVLKLLSGGSWILYNFGERFWVRRLAIVILSRGLGGIRRYLVWVLEPFSGLMIVGAVTSMFGTDGGMQWILRGLLLVHAGLMVALNVYVVSVVLGRSEPSNSLRRIRVWERLCRELGFDDRVLFRVAGVGWLPWSKDVAFNTITRDDGDVDEEEGVVDDNVGK